MPVAPGRLVGTDRTCPGCHHAPSLARRFSTSSSSPAVPANGSSTCPAFGALHVYQLAPCDWLVSDVGRDNEGRGADLIAALTVLFAGSSLDLWGPLVAGAAVMQALNEICRRASRM